MAAPGFVPDRLFFESPTWFRHHDGKFSRRFDPFNLHFMEYIRLLIIQKFCNDEDSRYFIRERIYWAKTSIIQYLEKISSLAQAKHLEWKVINKGLSYIESFTGLPRAVQEDNGMLRNVFRLQPWIYFLDFVKEIGGDEEDSNAVKKAYIKLSKSASKVGVYDFLKIYSNEQRKKLSDGRVYHVVLTPFYERASQFAATVTKVIYKTKQRMDIRLTGPVTVSPIPVVPPEQHGFMSTLERSHPGKPIRERIVREISFRKNEENETVVIVTYEDKYSEMVGEEEEKSIKMWFYKSKTFSLDEWNMYQEIFHTKQGQIDLGYDVPHYMLKELKEPEDPEAPILPYEARTYEKTMGVLYNEVPYGEATSPEVQDTNDNNDFFKGSYKGGVLYADYVAESEPIKALYLELIDIFLLDHIAGNERVTILPFILECRYWCAVEYTTYLRRISVYMREDNKAFFPPPDTPYYAARTAISKEGSRFYNHFDTLRYPGYYVHDPYSILQVWIPESKWVTPKKSESEFVKYIDAWKHFNESDEDDPQDLLLVGSDSLIVRRSGGIAIDEGYSEQTKLVMEAKYNSLWKSVREYFDFVSQPFLEILRNATRDMDLENFQDTSDTRFIKDKNSPIKHVQIDNENQRATVYHQDGSVEEYSLYEYQQMSKEEDERYKRKEVKLDNRRRRFRGLPTRAEELEEYIQKMKELEEDKKKAEEQKAMERKAILDELKARKRQWEREEEEEENDSEQRSKRERTSALISKISNTKGRLDEEDIGELLHLISSFVLDNSPLRSECISKIKEFRKWKNNKGEKETHKWVSEGKESIGALMSLLGTIQKESDDENTKKLSKNFKIGMQHVIIRSKLVDSSGSSS